MGSPVLRVILIAEMLTGSIVFGLRQPFVTFSTVTWTELFISFIPPSAWCRVGGRGFCGGAFGNELLHCQSDAPGKVGNYRQDSWGWAWEKQAWNQQHWGYPGNQGGALRGVSRQ